MTTDQQILWEKLHSFKLDDEGSSFQFSQRLARENGWTLSYSKKVIEEYKKFIFLCCIGSGSVTPSDQVDQAWHLHLTYTKSYWTELCKNTLSREIHHNPTKGGSAEGNKFDMQYSGTLQLYREMFQSEPPESIWPDNETRFSDIHFRRVNLKRYWLFRKPGFNKKMLSVFFLIFLSFFFIQSSSSNNSGTVIGLFICLGIAIYAIFNNKNGGGSGCSSTGCGGDSGHSGCGGDSGCGGSGCGGGCGD